MLKSLLILVSVLVSYSTAFADEAEQTVMTCETVERPNILGRNERDFAIIKYKIVLRAGALEEHVKLSVVNLYDKVKNHEADILSRANQSATLMQITPQALRSPSQVSVYDQYVRVQNRKYVPLKHKSGKMVLGHWGKASFNNSVRMDSERRIFCVMGGVAPSDL